MKTKFFFVLAIGFMTLTISCSKADKFETVLYANDFNTATDLDHYQTNEDEFTIEITTEDAMEGSDGCLIVQGWCSTMLGTEIGPFEVDYMVKMEAWMKTSRGAALIMNVKGAWGENISMETNSDLEVARTWNFYTSDELLLPKGEVLNLLISASNTTISNNWFDEVRVYGEAQ